MTRRESKVEPAELQRQPPAGRGEWIAIAAVVLLAGALRFAYPSRLAVEHFDEGVYASNIWFGEASDYRYPARHLYAPPLLPALIEWSIILFGAGSISVKLVSLLAGVATVGVVWWVGRRWFGREAGLAAAVLAALSDVHIVYSRMALTDVLMCLWLLIAVGCVHEMLVRGRHGWAVAAGLATGLAWATKYNGWLPVAIAVSGFVFYALISWWKSSEKPVAWRGFAVSMLLMVVTAVVVWSPVWFDLQERGGYAAVAANHRGYLGGLSKWLPSLSRQIDNHHYLEGWVSVVGLLLASTTAVFVRCRRLSGCTWNGLGNVRDSGQAGTSHENATLSVDRFGLTATLLLTLTGYAVFGSSLTMGILTIAGVYIHLRRRGPSGPSTTAYCLVAVWFFGLSAATPFYYPYPRLTLPWLMATWLGSGATIGWLVTRHVRGRDDDVAVSRLTSRWMVAGSLILCCVTVYQAANRWNINGIRGWTSQVGVKQVATDIATEIGSASPGGTIVIQVYAEPGLYYQLAAQQHERYAVMPVGSLRPPGDSPTMPTYLVTGPNAQREREFTPTIESWGDRLELVAKIPYQPGEVVLLNWDGPYSRSFPGGPRFVRLYRVW